MKEESLPAFNELGVIQQSVVLSLQFSKCHKVSISVRYTYCSLFVFGSLQLRQWHPNIQKLHRNSSYTFQMSKLWRFGCLHY